MLRQIIKFIKWNLISILIIAALLIGLRIALPHVVKWYVNKTLDEMPEYDGQIGDVDMKLWRGVYEIEDIHIIKTTSKVPVPSGDVNDYLRQITGTDFTAKDFRTKASTF